MSGICNQSLLGISVGSLLGVRNGLIGIKQSGKKQFAVIGLLTDIWLLSLLGGYHQHLDATLISFVPTGQP